MKKDELLLASSCLEPVPPTTKYSQPLWTSVCSGTVGGVVAVIVGYPFESVKVRLQTGQKTGMFRSLYKGILAPLAGVTPQWALMYFSYFASQAAMQDIFSGPENALKRGAASGFACGLIVATVVTPTDAVKIVAQNEKISASKAFASLLRRGGLRGALCHGFLATAVHLGLSQAIFFATYEYVLATFEDNQRQRRRTRSDEGRNNNIDWRPAVAGGVAGIVEWTTCLPTDTVKTRLQAGAIGASYFDVLRATYNDFGLRGFYRGYLPIL